MKWIRAVHLHVVPSDCALKAAMVRVVDRDEVFFPAVAP